MADKEHVPLDETARDWIVIRLDVAAPGGIVRHAEGVNQVDAFTLPEARQFWARMNRDEPDRGWRLVHQHTLVTPLEHEAWLNGGGKKWAP